MYDFAQGVTHSLTLGLIMPFLGVPLSKIHKLSRTLDFRYLVVKFSVKSLTYLFNVSLKKSSAQPDF